MCWSKTTPVITQKGLAIAVAVCYTAHIGNREHTKGKTMKPGDYQINPSVQVNGYAAANGVYVNLRGEAFIGDVVPIEAEGDHKDNTTGLGVHPYCDDGGDYIAAPAGWELRVVRALVVYS